MWWSHAGRPRYASPDHCTVIGALLPDLVRDAQLAARLYAGADRNRAQALVADVLGSVVVAQGEPAPAQTVAYGPSERITEALYTGDGAGMLDAFIELVRDVAGRLDGIDDASLQEWLTDKDLAGQLEVEGDRLRQSAARLAVLRDRVARDLATQPPPSPGEGDNGDQQ
jgi:hypothetical protein